MNIDLWVLTKETSNGCFEASVLLYDLNIMVPCIVYQNAIFSWELSTSTHFAYSIHSINFLSEVFPVVFTTQDLQISCWSSWPTMGKFFKCLTKSNCQCWRKSMQRLIVFSVPSAALGKLNQKTVKLKVKLDNFHDYCATFLIKFTPPLLHEDQL